MAHMCSLQALQLKQHAADAFAAGQYEEALHLLCQAVAACPGSDARLLSTLHSNRAAAHAAMDEWHLSLQDAEQAVAKDPHWPQPYLRQTTALCHLGRYTEASQALQAGLSACAADHHAELHNALKSVEPLGKLFCVHQECADTLRQKALIGDASFENRPLKQRKLPSSISRSRGNQICTELPASQQHATCQGDDVSKGHAASKRQDGSKGHAASQSHDGPQGHAVFQGYDGPQGHAAALQRNTSSSPAAGDLQKALSVLMQSGIPDQPIPVTVVSGFLGSGKTTLIQHLLSLPQAPANIAVLVNDMAEVNIDASLIRQASHSHSFQMRHAESNVTTIGQSLTLWQQDDREHPWTSAVTIACSIQQHASAPAVPSASAVQPPATAQSAAAVQSAAAAQPTIAVPSASAVQSASVVQTAVAKQPAGVMVEGGVEHSQIVSSLTSMKGADAVSTQGAMRPQDVHVVELSNGCICCSLKGDMLLEVAELLCRQPRPEVLLIESTGIGEPLPIAAALMHKTSQGPSLSDFVRLDTMVTVVDASSVLELMQDAPAERPRAGIESSQGTGQADIALAQGTGQVSTRPGKQPLAQLLVDQIEFADVILLNKCDLVREERQLDRVQHLVAALNPRAAIFKTIQSAVGWEHVVGTSRFDLAVAQRFPSWRDEQVLGSAQAHTPETEQYGITSISYKARAPFHPVRLWHLLGPQQLNNPTTNPATRQPNLARLVSGRVLRGKGVFWIASMPEVKWDWSLAGTSTDIQPSGRWLASMLPEDHWHEQADKLGWDITWGDREQQLVVIGQGLQRDEVVAALDECLLTEQEVALGEDYWKEFEGGPWLEFFVKF